MYELPTSYIELAKVTCYFRNKCDMPVQFELFHLHENVCLCSRYKSLSLARLQLKFSKCGTLGVPETFAGRLWGQNYFHNNTRILFAFFNVDIGVDGAKVLSWVKLLVPDYKLRQWSQTILVINVFFTITHWQKEKTSQFHLRMSFEEAVKMNNCVKSQPWVVFLIFCVTKGEMCL